VAKVPEREGRTGHRQARWTKQPISHAAPSPSRAPAPSLAPAPLPVGKGGDEDQARLVRLTGEAWKPTYPASPVRTPTSSIQPARSSSNTTQGPAWRPPPFKAPQKADAPHPHRRTTRAGGRQRRNRSMAPIASAAEVPPAPCARRANHRNPSSTGRGNHRRPPGSVEKPRRGRKASPHLGGQGHHGTPAENQRQRSTRTPALPGRRRPSRAAASGAWAPSADRRGRGAPAPPGGILQPQLAPDPWRASRSAGPLSTTGWTRWHGRPQQAIHLPNRQPRELRGTGPPEHSGGHRSAQATARSRPLITPGGPGTRRPNRWPASSC